MGNTDQTPKNAALRRERSTDTTRVLLSRVGDRLGADRVELFSFDSTVATVVDRWVAMGMPIALGENREVPLGWFPWSLGSIRPNEYLFVRNAGMLPMSEPPMLIGADLSIGAALMLPLIVGGSTLGALCVYWREERQTWESSERELVASWALDGLLAHR